MKFETEEAYVNRTAHMDSHGGWSTGAMYGVGLSDDGVGDDESVSITPSGEPTGSWLDVFKTALPLVASTYQQNQLMKLNIARINANQPPLTPAQIESIRSTVPTAQVQVGATQDTKRLMLYAAIGVAALVGLRAAKVI